MTNKDKITVFYARDDCYIPYLSVSLLSLIENSSKNECYDIIILHNGLLPQNMHTIQQMATDNISIRFTDVSSRLRQIGDQLSLRDYYSLSIYFRLFIPSMFPEIDKAIYLDSDTVVLADIAELYHTELGHQLVAAISDAVIASEDIFSRYAVDAVGAKTYQQYFNSGVMVMNLAQMRAQDLQGTFTNLLNTYHFSTICPDQDYLNVICRDRVVYLDCQWNKMSVDASASDRLCLIHFNMYFKPWHYDDVPYQEYFWRYAKHAPYYQQILAEQESFGAAGRQADVEAGSRLRQMAQAVIDDTGNFKHALGL